MRLIIASACGLLSSLVLAACTLAAPSATPTPEPQPTAQGGQGAASLRQRFQDWPEDYRFAVDEDTVVRLAYPSPIIDWPGFAFIDHIPSASSVTLARPFRVVAPDGTASPGQTQNVETIAGEELVIYRHYQSEPGEARLEEVLSDEGLVRGIAALGRRALPQGWPEAGPPQAVLAGTTDPRGCPPGPAGREELKPYTPEPNAYCGWITVDGEYAPDGTQVEAVVEGNICDTGEVSGGHYRVTVVSPYCGKAGDTVYFRVGGQWAREAGKVTHPLMGWQLDLTLDQPLTESAAPGSDNSAPLPPNLVRVRPVDGTPVGIDFGPCATFDITEEGVGREWNGPVWFQLGGVEIQRGVGFVNSRTDPTERTKCGVTLRSLLEKDTLESMPPVTEGPIDITVRYQDPSAQEHRYSWQVRLTLTAPQAPAEVHRVRQAYELFQQVREQARSGVADYFLDLDGGVLYVYLTWDGDPESVRPIVEEVFADQLPPGGVQVILPDYSIGQLPAWYREAWRVVWAVEGTQSSDLDERRDRIEFRVQTEYGAHQARKALARTGVPQEAVVMEVSPANTLDDPPEQENSPIGVGISLDFPRTVWPGQVMPIEVVLANQGEERASFTYNPSHPANVMVFTPKGDQVWAKRRGGLINEPAREVTLAPGEEIRFKTYWNLTDQDGFALPPGRYLVRGTSGIHDHVDGRIRPMDLASRPYELVIEVAEE